MYAGLDSKLTGSQLNARSVLQLQDIAFKTDMAYELLHSKGKETISD
jgi:hypothetical protein